MMPSLVLRAVISEVTHTQLDAERQIERADSPELVSYAAGKLTAYTFVLALLNLALIDVIAFENGSG